MNKNNRNALIYRIRNCARKNAFYIIVTYFLCSLLTLLCQGIFLVPSFMIPSRIQNLSPATLKIINYATIFLILNITIIFQYGFHQILLRMQREKFVTIGFLFEGWKKFADIKKLSALISALICGYLLLCSLAAGFFKQIFSVQYENFVSKYGDIVFFYGVLGISILIGFFIFLPFVFSLFIRSDEPKLTSFEVLKKSCGLMKGHFFEFIGFVIFAGGKNLFLAIFAFVISLFLTPEAVKESAFLNVSSIFIDFSLIINSYSAMVKMSLALPFFYGHLKFGKRNNVEVENNPAIENEVAAENDVPAENKVAAENEVPAETYASEIDTTEKNGGEPDENS